MNRSILAPFVYPILWGLIASVIFAPAVMSAEPNVQSPRSSVYRLNPGDELQYEIQELLIKAVPGDVIEFAEGTFVLNRQIDIATHHLTLRGQGEQKTILDFSGQRSGGQGIEVTGNHFVIENLAIENTSGNAIKVLGSRDVTFRGVRAEWTGEAKSTNGAYGLYPVQCSNVLIENCIARGASDSGIYVGQSRRVAVRNCVAERNVAGIEIENTIDAVVHDNVATNNAAGLLVFDLPGLQQKRGHTVHLFRNRSVANNHRNFAAPGNIVASVPSGTGVMVMATDRVEIDHNIIKDNRTANVALVSYLVSGKKVTDATYDPISESVSIHDNEFSGGGEEPQGEIGLMLSVLGKPLPDILFDGVVNPDRFVEGKLPETLRHSIVDNGDATFINFDLQKFSPKNVLTGDYRPSRDLSPHAHRLASVKVKPVVDHDPPSGEAGKAVLAYRAAPRLLSEYGLFKGNGATQEPAQGVQPYALNTSLFSDYAAKYRFIQVPGGSSIEYTRQDALEFPEGTVIAKTFAYPHDRNDLSKGRELIETRVQVLQDGEWYGYSYLWNDEQTDAELLLGGGEKDVSWIHDDGDKRSIRYEIPNANQCLNCHSQNGAYVPIGPTAANMNRDFAYAEGTANQLDYLAGHEMLSGLPAADARERLPDSEDASSGTLDQRAHAWLHVNCAHCHSPAGVARTSGLDLRYRQSDPGKFGVWKTPVAAGHASGGMDYDIVPGKPDKSILMYRLKSNEPSVRMPSVGRAIGSAHGTELIESWIQGMSHAK